MEKNAVNEMEAGAMPGLQAMQTIPYMRIHREPRADLKMILVAIQSPTFHNPRKRLHKPGFHLIFPAACPVTRFFDPKPGHPKSQTLNHKT